MFGVQLAQNVAVQHFRHIVHSSRTDNNIISQAVFPTDPADAFVELYSHLLLSIHRRHGSLHKSQVTSIINFVFMTLLMARALSYIHS
jgi:hypothetical protein